MKKLKGLVSLILVICFIFMASPITNAQEYGSYLEAMLGFMTEMYYEGLTDEEALTATLKGMFSQLDDYSEYYDKEETQSYINNLNNTYQGIGASLQNDDNGIRVVEVFEESPAEESGLHSGDIITAIDGKSVVGMDATSAATLIRGEAGTEVKLTILRDELKTDLFIIRGSVINKSVTYRIEGRIGYISIDSFNRGTSKEFDIAIKEINKAKIEKIILDLRGNPGGYVDEAVAIARKLIPEGIVTTLDYKSENYNDQVFYSYGNNPDYIIAVLVDENSASASEILAGALYDTGVGFLVGQTTFGKGVFQNIFSVLTPKAYSKYRKKYGIGYVTDIEWMGHHGVSPEEDEIIGSVKLTTGHYLTPRNKSINGVGLKPSLVEPNPTNPGGINLSQVTPVKENVELHSYNSDVFNAEKTLKAAGYMDATADRLFDDKTLEAVKKYQADKKLPLTGKIETATRNKLNETLNELRKNNDKQYTKALEVLNWFSD
ncbi:MAG: S41 family peptidase [Clostridiaceae bacterium]|nr:S41 family peptidase [Clostridiaceae bacterium]